MAEADSLFAVGKWFDATIAYEKIYYFSVVPEQKLQANLGKARSLKQEGRYREAYHDLERSLTVRSSDSLRLELFYEMAFCSYMSGATGDAASLLIQLKHFFPDNQDEDRIRLLQSMVLIREQKQEELNAHVIEWIRSKPIALEQKDHLLSELSLLLDEAFHSSRRDPGKARIWATFLPGSGHVYAGHAGHGLINAFSQLASLTAAVALGFHGFYIAGTIAGLGSFQSFYFGGIKQAGELTEKRNARERASSEAMLMRFVLQLAGE